MTRYIALPLLAIVAACAAEVENGEAGDANRVDNLVVENLIITDSEMAGATETETQPTAQPAPPAETPAARQSSAQPKEQDVRRPAAEAQPKAPARPVQPKAAPPAEPKEGAAPPDGSCPPEHREMGHC
jgi:hypothetical protein